MSGALSILVAYPGAKYLRGSTLASDWARRVNRAMHEVVIETNAHQLQLVFHSLRVQRIGAGDPATGTVTPVEPEDLVQSAT